jgi:C-terminal processing protease CtpA/Prc
MTKLYAICLTIISCCVCAGCGNKLVSTTSNNSIQSTENQAKTTSIVALLKENAQLPIAEQIALYHKVKAENTGQYNFSNEPELTMYGYAFLWKNKLDEAIAIFKLIVAEFPQSANAYDSLGEAYLQAKDSIKALENYEQSLAMNPDNFHAEDVIEQIKNPAFKPLSAAEKFSKVYTKAEYHADLDQLGQKLSTIHPYVFKFISKEQFWKNIELKKALISEKTTYAEFAWHCNAIIASIGCSHTASYNWDNGYHELTMLPLEQTFPLKVRWINKQLFVVDPMNSAGEVNVKAEILSINGVETAQLMTDIFAHIPAQANIQTAKAQKFNTYFAALIPYTLGLPKTFEIVVKGQNGVIQLNKTKNFATELYDPAVSPCNNDLCLEKIDHQTAILTIRSFNYYEWNNYPVFKAFLDSSMQVVKNQKLKNLIIDVRYNGGGSQYPSIYLLQHLSDKPFTYYAKADFEGKTEKMYGEAPVYPHENRFKGKVYFLIDGHGNSTTGHFMSLVKSMRLGTIIGEELGSNQFCTAGQALCRLSHTKFVITIANNTHVSTATMLPDGKGILPDHTVTQNIDDYLQKVDVVKQYALKLISQ